MDATGAKSRGGRPKGSRSKSTIEREERIRLATSSLAVTNMEGLPVWTAEQISAMSPIEIMQFAAVVEATQGRWLAAADLASKLAPYLHPRLSQTKTETTIKRSVKDLTDDELHALASDGEGEDGDSSEAGSEE